MQGAGQSITTWSKVRVNAWTIGRLSAAIRLATTSTTQT